MERLLVSTEELKKICNNQPIMIYGAGESTYQLLLYLSKINIDVKGVIVTTHVGNPSEILGIPVKSIEEYVLEESNITVLINVRDIFVQEISNELEKRNIKNYYVIKEDLKKEIKYRNADLCVDIYNETQKLKSELKRTEEKFLRFVERPCLEYMIVHILDHCNLRCKGCDHFACIADENFIDVKTIKKDLERMSFLFGGDYITKIAVMGGEPLLHPELNEILAIVRKNFPYTNIRLTTNGILLLSRDEEFWKTCRENNVQIVVTKYPLQLDFDGMKKKAEEEMVEFKFFEDTDAGQIKRSFKKTINLNGDCNPAESFANCHISNYGNMLLDGKFYGCAFSVQSTRIFNKRFNQNLRLAEEDYLDIYKVNKKEEFFKYAARPKYFCRYCSGKSPVFPWERSKQNIDEWVDIES